MGGTRQFSLLQIDTKEINMDTKLTFILFFCIIYDVCSSSLNSKLTRTKRWENGDMGPSDMSNMFRGTAGVDYPDYKTIPNTNFRCEDKIYEGGLYADVETNCQVYHVCHDGRKDSFLCGRGTIFNQQILACDYWYSAECDSAPNYYYLNSQIGNSVSPNKVQDYSQNGANYPISENGGSSGSNQRISNKEGNVQFYDGHKQPCHCLKGNYRTPWSFPAGLMHGSDK